VGFPIRKSTDQSFFAAPRGLSQRSTSFIASQRQGIHRTPLRHLIALIINAHPLGVAALIRKTSLLRDRPDVPCGQAWNDKHRTPCSPRDVAVLQRALRLMLEIACAHRIFILPAHSERSPLHDVRQPARRSFDATRETVHFRTSRRRVSMWRPDWWSQTGSNRRPPACKAGALPTELWPLVQRELNVRAERWPASRSSRPKPRLRPVGLRRAVFTRLRERRLVGLGRFELPTSRLSSARSNQLSYKPLTWRTAERSARSRDRRTRPARARPRRKRNEDGEVPPMDICGLNRSALMFPRDPIATARCGL
jgi:hypothetical protein